MSATESFGPEDVLPFEDYFLGDLGDRLFDGRKFGPWEFKRNWTLRYRAYSGFYYEIDLDRIDGPEEMLDWIFQVGNKSWCDAACMHGLIEAFEVLYHPQALIGGFAPPRRDKGWKEILRQRPLTTRKQIKDEFADRAVAQVMNRKPGEIS